MDTVERSGGSLCEIPPGDPCPAFRNAAGAPEGAVVHLPCIPQAFPADAAPHLAATAACQDRWFTTVLFIDIVDSTRRAACLGDSRWLEVAEAYELEVRRLVRRHRGRVLVVAGDGMVAAFTSAAAGVRCAAEINQATRSLGLDVRAGLHAGECQRRGRRVGGIVFNIGARLAALAEGGEVLVSDAVKDSAGEGGLVFTARGVRRLRGVPGRWPVYSAQPSHGDDRAVAG